MPADPRSGAAAAGARLLESAGEVKELARRLAGEPLLALDTEADSFHSYFHKVCLVQISTRQDDFIVDPLAAGTLDALGSVLADPRVTCVLHGADYDLRILDRDHGLRVAGLFDTMVAARLLGHTAFGLQRLLQHYFDVQIPKEHQRADWARRPLTPEMLRYAATDTHYLPALHDRLRGELEARGRLEWAEEEFRQLEQVRHQPRREDTHAYLKVKGARGLDRPSLAALRELHELRDGIARREDRAPFRVLGNPTLVELARRRPKRPRDLAGVPGLPRALRRDLERGILEAVQRAADSPAADLAGPPRRPRGPAPPPDPAMPLLRDVRDRVAKDLGMDPALVAPNALLEAVARTRPGDRQALVGVPGMRRWQAEVLGEPLLRALRVAGPPPAA